MMIQDVLLFSFVLVVVILCFACAFTFLIRYDAEVKGFRDFPEIIFTLLFSIYDPFMNYDPSISPFKESDEITALSDLPGYYGNFTLVHIVLLLASLSFILVLLLN